MRAFIAVELSETARGAVARLQDALRPAGADVKWVEPQNLHLTLKFLGEAEEPRLPELTQVLESAASHLSPFTFSLEGVGAFPRLEYPRIVWTGIQEGKESLVALANQLEEACGRCGFSPEERPFSPHLTIGRVRSGKRLAFLVQQLRETTFQTAAPVPAEKIVLFQSILSPRGATYSPLREIPLG